MTLSEATITRIHERLNICNAQISRAISFGDHHRAIEDFIESLLEIGVFGEVLMAQLKSKWQAQSQAIDTAGAAHHETEERLETTQP